MLLSPARKSLVETERYYYHPFGDQVQRNVLNGFKGYQNTIKVLFLGSFDLMNVLKTIGTKNIIGRNLNIHLNFSCSLGLARNVLLLKIISAPNFNINSPDDANYLWDLWYNFQWPKTTLQRFTVDVKSLMEEGLPEYCSQMKCDQVDILQEIFTGWLTSLTSGKLTESFQMEGLLKERVQHMFGGFGELNEVVASTSEGRGFPSPSRLATSLAAILVPRSSPEFLKKKLEEELLCYFNSGTCNFHMKNVTVALNPTLLEPKTNKWRVRKMICPYLSYFPFHLDENDAQEGHGATKYCQKVLFNLISEYRRKQKTVQFHFQLSDHLQFCLSDSLEKFDAIDSSTLADKVGLANLILSASQRLDLHPDAVLLTQSKMWACVTRTEPLTYVEESLCAPLNMIPTIYGLRLANHVELGSAIAADYGATPLYWHRVSRSENLPISSSSILERCLKSLERKCYFVEEEENAQERLNFLNKCYTPLTLNFVTTRLDNFNTNQDTPIRMQLWKSELAPRFTLARQTLDAWTNNHPVISVVVTQPFNSALQRLYDHNKLVIQAQMLRIILVPFDSLAKGDVYSTSLIPIHWAAANPGAHYIDNFDLVCLQNEDGSCNSLQVSFLLPHGHGLDGNYCGALVDLSRGSMTMFLGLIKDMHQQEFNIPHPTAKQISKISSTISQEPHMQVLRCQESGTIYHVQILIHAENDPQGLSISTDQKLPCESSHRITFSLAQPEGIKPLTLCFSYPFLVDDIDVRRSKNSIRVVLKKACYEPWPLHFDETSKSNAEKLAMWKEQQPLELVIPSSQFYFHVLSQTDPCLVAESLILSPLQHMRKLITQMFLCYEKNITIFIENYPLKPLWSIHIHRPVLTSPSGSPMLLLSAIDYRLAYKLVTKGKLQKKKFERDVQRFVERKGGTFQFPINGEDTADLIRYVLRLNSCKIVPTSWQEQNLPLGESSPFLATFISLLYLDFSAARSENTEWKYIHSFDDLLPAFHTDHCIQCGIQKGGTQLKRCSKCKSVYYCSAECQRVDWAKHKTVCTYISKY